MRTQQKCAMASFLRTNPQWASDTPNGAVTLYSKSYRDSSHLYNNCIFFFYLTEKILLLPQAWWAPTAANKFFSPSSWENSHGSLTHWGAEGSKKQDPERRKMRIQYLRRRKRGRKEREKEGERGWGRKLLQVKCVLGSIFLSVFTKKGRVSLPPKTRNCTCACLNYLLSLPSLFGMIGFIWMDFFPWGSVLRIWFKYLMSNELLWMSGDPD